MIVLDEDALKCDFAETYHIYDIYALDVEYAAILACGLRDNSRIRLKANGLKVDTNVLLLARIADAVTMNVYAKTKDAQHGRNVPKSIVEALTHEENNDLRSFTTGEEFDTEWRRLINGN
jgi:hypothetical protein